MDHALSLIGTFTGLYLVPGFCLTRLVRLRGLGRTATVMAWLALSVLLGPPALVFLSGIAPALTRPDRLLSVLAAISCAVGLGGLALRRCGLACELSFSSAEQSCATDGAVCECRIARATWALCVLLLPVLLILPRVNLLWSAPGAPPVPAIPDDYWHVSEIAAVAATGIPPGHYLEPAAPLSFYYGAWVLPAAACRAMGGALAVREALAVHAFVVQLVFVAAVAFVLRRRARHPAARAFGLLSLAFLGGLDAWFVPAGVHCEWWQLRIGWLASNIQVSNMVTHLMWVPHHVQAGAAVLAGWIVATETGPGAERTKAAALGLLGAAAAGASAFVALSGGVLVVTGFLSAGTADRRRAFLRVAVPAALLAAVLALPLARIYLGREPLLRPSPFRILFSGRIVLDKLLTLPLLPVVGPGVLAIELGLVFVLFVLWSVRDRPWRSGRWEARVLFWFPAAYCALIFLVSAKGANNFSTRGMLPAQTLMLIAAARHADGLLGAAGRRATRWALGVPLLAVFVWTPVAEFRRLSGEALADLAGAAPRPEASRYIDWLNRHTEPDAVILEEHLPLAPLWVRMLERVRIVDLRSAAELPGPDRELLRGRDIPPRRDPAELLRDRPVYIVVRRAPGEMPGSIDMLSPAGGKEAVKLYRQRVVSGVLRPDYQPPEGP